MAVDFFFDPPTYSIPSLSGLRSRWANIPNPDVAEMIAREEQYLLFHRFVLDHAKFTKVGELHSKPYVYSLGLSVRAGAIKAAILVCASIAEAALRAHAEKREYKFPSEPTKRTFGRVISAWKSSRGKPRPDVRVVWKEILKLRDARNNIHLFKAASDPSADFKHVLDDEPGLLESGLKVVEHLSMLKSP